ncbi:MAG TPA: hypothetical protein VFA18_14020 [Gemmataceae bacterium]|nr:hypothetical protein [Gemmataceae bacterium]
MLRLASHANIPGDIIRGRRRRRLDFDLVRASADVRKGLYLPVPETGSWHLASLPGTWQAT